MYFWYLHQERSRRYCFHPIMTMFLKKFPIRRDYIEDYRSWPICWMVPPADLSEYQNIRRSLPEEDEEEGGGGGGD